MSPKVFVEQVEELSMSLSEFHQLYPGLSREQIARIAGCSVQTVHNWFAIADGVHRKPTDHHLLRLGLYHWILNAPDSIRDIISIVQKESS
jgi:hypothetical protein